MGGAESPLFFCLVRVMISAFVGSSLRFIVWSLVGVVPSGISRARTHFGSQRVAHSVTFPQHQEHEL